MNEEKLYKEMVATLEKLGISQNVLQAKGQGLLKSLCFLLSATPRYKAGEYVVIKNVFILRIPNKEIYARVSSVMIDYNKCEILYFVSYKLDNAIDYKVVKEKDISHLQMGENSDENYYGHDGLDRFQHLKMIERAEKLQEE